MPNCGQNKGKPIQLDESTDVSNAALFVSKIPRGPWSSHENNSLDDYCIEKASMTGINRGVVNQIQERRTVSYGEESLATKQKSPELHEIMNVSCKNSTQGVLQLL